MSSAVTKEIRDDQELRNLISDILARIRTEEDPDTLNAYRAVIRKHVPLFMRSYFAAYLFMKIDRVVPGRADGRGRKDRKEDGRKKGENPKQRLPERERRQPAPRPREEEVERERRIEEPRRSIPEAEAATLFVSAGRNRRAYARELLALIQAECGVAKDDVGELRVLDNFSFVQVRRSVADEIISGLDGKDFRGRPLAVSYAKPRKDELPRETASFADEEPAEGEPIDREPADRGSFDEEPVGAESATLAGDDDLDPSERSE
jgi:hypothetical protein